MTSMFRRRVEIVSTVQDATREVRATLEDDFHHFRVWLRHCDSVVSEIGGEAVRYPYSACPLATEQLQQLVGMPLSQIAHSVTRQTDAQHQCTHLLDLAGLAIANAARGTTQRRYDIQVPDRIDERTNPLLQRDGTTLLSWDVHGSTIEGPPPTVGPICEKGWLAGRSTICPKRKLKPRCCYAAAP